jgi:hemerythrin
MTAVASLATRTTEEGKQMTLIWRKQLEIGDEAIDTDHKYLICLINTVELTLRTPQNRELLPTTLAQLEEYTHTHFEREESIMLAIRYSRYDQHKIQHQLLLKELAAIQKKIEAKGDGEFTEEECTAIATLFRHWLLDHLVKEDTQLRAALTGK